MKTESVAFLQDDARWLPPDFDDEGFGHGTVSLEAEVSVATPTWCRQRAMTMVDAAQPAANDRRPLAYGINMATTLLPFVNMAKHGNDDASMTRTARLRTATLALLALLFCISTAGAVDPSTATIMEHGIYTLDTGERSRQPSGVMTTTVSNLCHILSTATIPARRNLWFGFRFRLDGPANGTLVTLRLITHFPVPVKPPRTFRDVTSYERMIGAIAGVAQFTGYGFEEDWEFKPGPWTFELFDGDRLLTEQRFMVVRDNGGPALSDGDRVDCFAMTRLDGPDFDPLAL